MPLSAQEEAYRQEIAAWIRGIETRFRVRVQEIAARATLNPSTVYRLKKLKVNPDLRSLRQIAEAFDLVIPGEGTVLKGHNGFAEGDVAPLLGYDQNTDEKPPERDQSDWLINNRALDLAGCLPGDIVRMDMRVSPRPGDIVIAQVYEMDLGTAKTLIRLFAPPYLMIRSTDPTVNEKPLYVDQERVAIMGTVVSLRRQRQ
ncbi:MAG TPA: hypothetical protein VGG12_06955 [Methylovirgula sp.]